MGLKVLHCFDYYLPATEIWAYNLISKIPEVENHIAAKVYLENKSLKNTYPRFIASTSEIEKDLRGLAWRKQPLKKVVLTTRKRFSRSYEDELKEYISKHEIDIVHAHFGNVGWSLMDLVAQNSLPLIVSFYGYDYSHLVFSDSRWLNRYKALFNSSALFLTEGGQGRKALIEMGCPAEKIQIQSLGINLEKGDHKQILKEPQELRLVQLASFAEKKGQKSSIEAFALAIKNCPNLKMDLIGDVRDEAYFEEVKSLVKSLNLEEKIIIKHFVEYKKLKATLERYQVFIHPSCYTPNRDCEGGAPTIMFNAGSVGLPIISTKHCDIPAVVIDQKTGSLSEEKDIESLSKSIELFYNMEQDVFTQYAVASRQHIYANFSLSKNSQELRDKYVRALS